MPTNRVPTQEPHKSDEPSGWRKWAWFLGLSLGGLLTTAALAYGLRGLLFLAT